MKFLEKFLFENFVVVLVASFRFVREVFFAPKRKMDSSKFGILKLNNENFQSWQFKTKMFLIREDLWKFVEPGTPPNPVTEVWTAGDAKALATIALLVEDNQHAVIMTSLTAKSAWDALQKFHHRATLNSKVSILKEICSKNFAHGGNMEDHLFAMEQLFVKLKNAGEEISESFRVALILRSLPETFNTLTTALEVRSDEELTLQLIRPKLLDEARKSGRSSFEMTMISTQNGSSGSSSGKKCFFCKSTGHIRKNCEKFLAKKRSEKDENTDKSKESAKNVVESKEFTFCATGSMNVRSEWFLDSGATSHMCNDRAKFTEFNVCDKSIVVADGRELIVSGIGKVSLKTVNEKGELINISLTKVLYVPGIASNLVSVSELTCRGAQVLFFKDGCKVSVNGKTAALGDVWGRVFKLKLFTEKACFVGASHFVKVQHGSHRKMGLRNTVNEEKFETKSCGMLVSCVDYLVGKLPAKPFPKKSNVKSRETLNLLKVRHLEQCQFEEETRRAGTLGLSSNAMLNEKLEKAYLVLEGSPVTVESAEKRCNIQQKEERNCLKDREANQSLVDGLLDVLASENSEDCESCIEAVKRDRFERILKKTKPECGFEDDLIKKQRIKPDFCSPEEMTDGLTRALQAVELCEFREMKKVHESSN